MPGGRPELDRAHDAYMELAKDIANDLIVDEIFPILKRAFPNSPIMARNWRPYRVNFRGPSDLGMKLKMDPFVAVILRTPKLLGHAHEIVLESLGRAFIRDTQIHSNPFIAAILRDLITEESRLGTPENNS